MGGPTPFLGWVDGGGLVGTLEGPEFPVPVALVVLFALLAVLVGSGVLGSWVLNVAALEHTRRSPERASLLVQQPGTELDR